ncbi:MAG TPA: hypothetical protein VJ755_01915 [Gemmatimonadales bacterium]|nr:hypothetical protein [Gemmatimonadales bacterium]
MSWQPQIIRLAVRMPLITVYALLVGCSSGSHQPGPPATVPAPAAIPPVTPSLPPLPSPNAPLDPAQRDSGGVKYPWPSGPIAAL